MKSRPAGSEGLELTRCFFNNHQIEYNDESIRNTLIFR